LVKKLAKSPSVANPWALAHKIQHQQEDKRTMNLFDQLVAKKKTRKARARAAVDTHAKRELELFLDNDGQMYARKTAFLNAAAKKMRAGTYDHALAGKLWLAWVNEGAKKYCSENYCPGATFSPATREAAAADVARHEHDALVRGERGAISIAHTPKVAKAKKLGDPFGPPTTSKRRKLSAPEAARVEKKWLGALKNIVEQDEDGPSLGHMSSAEMKDIERRGYITVGPASLPRGERWRLTDKGHAALRSHLWHEHRAVTGIAK
jgi:hypothetical protein